MTAEARNGGARNEQDRPTVVRQLNRTIMLVKGVLPPSVWEGFLFAISLSFSTVFPPAVNPFRGHTPMALFSRKNKQSPTPVVVPMPLIIPFWVKPKPCGNCEP